jgi:hypothetical protein
MKDVFIEKSIKTLAPSPNFSPEVIGKFFLPIRFVEQCDNTVMEEFSNH